MTISGHISKLPKLSANSPPETVRYYEENFIIAAEEGCLDDIRHLLKLGVDPNCLGSEDGITALHVAATRGDMTLLDILFDTGKLDLDKLSTRDTPAMVIAVRTVKEAFIRVMAQRGANVNVKDRLGMTPLHHALYLGSLSILSTLLDIQCDRNAMDEFYKTPLSIAVVDVASLPMVKMLIEGGASVNFDRGKDVMPLLLEACLHSTDANRLEIATYLLNHGADPNVTDLKTGRNALHMVAINDNVALAKILLHQGTLSIVKDVYSLTPYQIAKKHKNDALADLLEEAYITQNTSGWRLMPQKSVMSLPTLQSKVADPDF